MRPTACTQSHSTFAPHSWTISVKAAMSWIVPTSLLASMQHTSETSSPSLPRKASRSTFPVASTGIVSTMRPSGAAASSAPCTQACSMGVIRTCRRNSPAASRRQLCTARCAASVAPDTNTTVASPAFRALATSRRAPSRSEAAKRPSPWGELGFPKASAAARSTVRRTAFEACEVELASR